MIKLCFFGCLFAAECTAKEAFQYAGPNIVFASGSPFRDVDLGANPSSPRINSSFFWHAFMHVDQQHLAYI